LGAASEPVKEPLVSAGCVLAAQGKADAR